MLSPVLYSLYTYDCKPAHLSNNITKFADDITVVGLICGEDETVYRDEVQRLSGWCSADNLALNTTKTKEIILDFRRKHNADLDPLYISRECVESVHTFKFLGVHIFEDFSWSPNTTATIKKEQQRLHFLRVFSRNGVERKLLVAFYWVTVESVLSYCITVWYVGCSAADKKALQRLIRTAEKITGYPLPSLENFAISHYLSRAKNIVKDPSHPGHHQFELLPSSICYRAAKTCTNRFRDSFFPTAIAILIKQ